MRYDIGAAVAGVAFALLGGTFLLDALDVAVFRFEIVLPIAVIALGIGAILSSLFRSRHT